MDADIAAMRAIMSAAARALIGIPVRTDAKIILAPARYMDARGEKTWTKIMDLLHAAEIRAAA
jgi:hypothetical protein